MGLSVASGSAFAPWLSAAFWGPCEGLGGGEEGSVGTGQIVNRYCSLI